MDSQDGPSDCCASTDQAVDKGVKLGKRISKLKKKWEVCILQTTLDDEPENISINKQLLRCNTLIRTTKHYLKARERVVMFRQLCLEFREDDKFAKCVYILTIRWWFCWRFNLHLSLFPYLGYVPMLYNILLGIHTVVGTALKYTLVMMETHDDFNKFFDPLLTFTNTTAKIDVDFRSRELLNLLPKFSKIGAPELSNKICREFASFIAQFALPSLSEDINLENTEVYAYDDVLETIWKNIVKTVSSVHKDDCKYNNNVLVLLFSLYTLTLFKAKPTIEPLSFSAYLGRIHGFFVKWILEKDNVSKVELSTIKKVNYSPIDLDISKIQTHVDQCPITNFTQVISIKKEDGDSESYNLGIDDGVVMSSFGLFFSNAVQFYKGYDSIPPEILLISASLLRIENSETSFLENYQDLNILGTQRDYATLYSRLITCDAGREIISRELGDSKIYVPNLQFMDVNDEQKGGVCSCFYRIHENIVLASGGSLGVANHTVAISINDRLVKKTSVTFVLSKEFALHILNRVKILLEKKRTCISNMSIHPNTFTGDEKCAEFLKCTSPLVSTLISLATVMGDCVYVNNEDSNKGLIHIIIRFQNSITRSDMTTNLWNIFAKLLYIEISKDSKITLEHRNEQLCLYRTLLIRYLLQLMLLPSNFSYKLKIARGQSDISTTFIRRLFRLFGFRINRNFMNKEQFIRFLKTRAITRKPKPSDEDTEESDYEDLYYDWTVFGLLEYSPTHALKRDLLPKGVKIEDTDTENFTHLDGHDFYFFDVVYELFGILRFDLDFEGNIIDNYLSQFFTLLCSKRDDFMDEFNRDISDSSIIKAIFRTDEYGKKLDGENLLRTFGVFSKSNETLEIMGLLENKNIIKRRKLLDPDPIIESLILSNNRFKRRSFYRVSSRIIDAITRYADIQFITRALCVWNSSLPIDSVSSIKSHKVSSARSTFIILILRIMTVLFSNIGDLYHLISIEPIVSTINVIFINLELIHARQEFMDSAEVISSDDSRDSSFGSITRLKSEYKKEMLEDGSGVLEQDTFDNVLGVSVENLDNFNIEMLGNWKKNKLMNEISVQNRRKLLREQRHMETNLLLHVSHTFVGIINHMVSELSSILLDPKQGFLSKSEIKKPQGECSDSLVISCTGEMLGVYNNVLGLLSLIYETITTISRLCVILSFNSIHLEQNGYSEGLNSHGYSEDKTVELIKEIGIIKKKAKTELDYIFSIGPKQASLSELTTQDDDNISDDLDDFIDFETDRHLSMITYANQTSNVRTHIRVGKT